MAIHSEEMRRETSLLRDPGFKRLFDYNRSNGVREKKCWCIYCEPPDLPSMTTKYLGLQGNCAKVSEGEGVYFLLRAQPKRASYII